MFRPGGQATIELGDGRRIERDTFTCSHCNSIVICQPSPGQHTPDIGGFCRMCTKHICGPCADKGSCEPFERQLERMEQRGRFLNAIK